MNVLPVIMKDSQEMIGQMVVRDDQRSDSIVELFRLETSDPSVKTSGIDVTRLEIRDFHLHTREFGDLTRRAVVIEDLDQAQEVFDFDEFEPIDVMPAQRFFYDEAMRSSSRPRSEDFMMGRHDDLAASIGDWPFGRSAA